MSAIVSIWTREREAALTRLWARGHSASRIALEIDVSRSAVCAKARRLDLPARVQAANLMKASAVRRGEAPPTKRVPRHDDDPDAGALFGRGWLALAYGTGPGVGMGEIGRNQCVWPLWAIERPTFRVCGDPVEPGRPYCAAHCDKAYRLHATEAKKAAE